MTTEPIYDGSGKLSEAIAELCKTSPKSSQLIAKLIGQAKAGLGIASKSKNPTVEVKLAIWQWHYDRLHPVTDNPVDTISHDESPLTVDIVSPVNQDDYVEIILQSTPQELDAFKESHEQVQAEQQNNLVEINSQANENESVDIITQTEPGNIVEINSQPNQDEAVELFTQAESVETISHPMQAETVEIVSQDSTDEPVKIISQYAINDLVRIAFYTVNKGVKKRQVIALDGFYVNALMLVAGIDKKGVPAWVQQAVDGWAAFDPALPITRQVKYLLIRELTHEIRR